MITSEAKGLTIGVLRGQYDGTNGGVSRSHDRLTVVGYLSEGAREPEPMPVDSRVFTPTEDAPAVLLRVRRPFSNHLICDVMPTQLVKGFIVPERRWVMAGGNYASLGDSRLSDLVSSLLGHPFYGALSIHDRIEN